jgi:uncharacterized RmlC-like cupin family protein
MLAPTAIHKEVEMNLRTDAAPRFVVSGAQPYTSEQGTVYAPGICAETVGATARFLGIVTLAPGQRTKAHTHALHESAFYFLSGEEVELWLGEELRQCAIARPGDYLFIPAGVPHVAVNRSASKPAIFVGARNAASAQESTLVRPELDARVP